MADGKTRPERRTIGKQGDELRVAEKGRRPDDMSSVGSVPTRVRDPRPPPGEKPKGPEGGSKTGGKDN